MISEKKAEVGSSFILVNMCKKSDPLFPPSKLVSMVQAIKDLANAFVPSGRLIELVDITLVRAPPPPFPLKPLFYCS